MNPNTWWDPEWGQPGIREDGWSPVRLVMIGSTYTSGFHRQASEAGVDVTWRRVDLAEGGLFGGRCAAAGLGFDYRKDALVQRFRMRFHQTCGLWILYLL